MYLYRLVGAESNKINRGFSDITCYVWPAHPPHPPHSSSAAGWRSGCVERAAWLLLACLSADLTWSAFDWRLSTAAARPGLIL